MRGARLEAEERVGQVREGPEKGVAQDFALPAEASSVNFPASRYRRRCSAASAALLQIGANNAVNLGHKLLAMFNDPSAQVGDFEFTSTPVFGAFKAAIEPYQEVSRS